MSVVTRPAALSDSRAIAAIYNYYVRETVVTFDEEEITADGMAAQMEDGIRSSLPWLVAEEQGSVIGHAYAGTWHGRCAYRFSVESTVYLDHRRTGRGVGTTLYRELLAILRRQSMHVVIGGIALPNAASIALHERLGFAKVAHFNEVGFKFGRWIDVGYWQTIL
jgi:phosphinothricin acetyltransferase